MKTKNKNKSEFIKKAQEFAEQMREMCKGKKAFIGFAIDDDDETLISAIGKESSIAFLLACFFVDNKEIYDKVLIAVDFLKVKKQCNQN